ncbi:MAG: LysR family transcriptional regulator [Sulfuritalea sp.]|nr:LysR family transcriptional regulator [Sulfuritalea sp.]
MNKLLQIEVLVAVVRSGSFVGAAEVLGVSKAAVSRHVGELEARLGVRLLQRTTRRLSLTEAGQIFHARSKDILDSVSESEDEISTQTGTASGQLRISAPVTFGVRHLAPLWGEFRRRHPRVTLDITLADRVVDLIEEGYDLAIRIGRLSSSTLVSRRLAITRMVLCAAPDYLATHGTPRHPHELADHEILAYSYWSDKDEWRFDGPDGAVSVRTQPCLSSNSGDTCRAAALAGQGVILQPSFVVDTDLAAGTLVELMPEYRAVELGIYAVYPTRKHVPAKVRALLDFLGEKFGDAGRFS